MRQSFPVLGGYSGSNAGSTDVFVQKYAPTGQLLFSTYLGGTAADSGNAIAVTTGGDVWLAGTTASSGFPTFSPLFTGTYNGGTSDAFVVKLAPSGDSLEFSSFLGGSAAEGADALALDAQGDCFIGGNTYSNNYPTASPYQATQQDATYGSGFVTALAPTGGGVLWSTYLGSNSTQSQVNGLAVSRYGTVYATGFANYEASLGHAFAFPTTTGAYQTTASGTEDAFLTTFSSTGSLGFSTVYGGNNSTVAIGVAIDASGYAFLAGYTGSTTLPTTVGAYQSSLAGTTNAFAARFEPGLLHLIYGTYLGGSGTDQATGVAVDSSDQVTLVGSTTSTNFPVSGAFQSTSGGGTDAFVTQLNSTATALKYSSYYGGSSNDAANGVALDYLNDAFFTGYTSSSNLPTANPAQSYGGGQVAFVAEAGVIPPAPAVTAVSPGTQLDAVDYVTSSQNLTLPGTEAALATVTLYRADLTPALGTTTATSGGAWSFDYTGTTLPEGTYAFQATAGLSTSGKTPPFRVIVDLTVPTVNLTFDASNPAKGPQLTVSASDSVGIHSPTTVTIDVDLNNDGDYLDSGEAGYATATMTSGLASFGLTPALSAGSYHIRADVTDLAGNVGHSASQSLTITTIGTSTLTGLPNSIDPVHGDAQLYLGTLQVAQPLDLDNSPGTDLSGNSALVYNSDRVSVQPIVSVQLATPNNVALPATITAQLTWNNGTPQTAQSYSTTGLSPGETFLISQQVSTAVTSTGQYPYTMQVVLNYTTPVTLTYSGGTDAVVEDSSAFGAGWTMGGVDRLFSITGTGGLPSGILREYGTGSWGFYTLSGGSYTSPAWDNGTLTTSGGNYQYTTPDGQASNFNSSGYLTSRVSGDGLTTTTFTWSAGLLQTIQTADGATSTFTYASSKLSTIATGTRTVTVTMSAGDLTQFTNADGGVRTFGYSSHKLISDTWASQPTTYAYSNGVLSGWTAGSGSEAGSWALSPTVVPGLSVLSPKAPQAPLSRTTLTDPLGRKQAYDLDSQARVLTRWDAAGQPWHTPRNIGGWITSSTDPLGNTTTYGLDSSGYVTLLTNPGGTTEQSVYAGTNHHALTKFTDERGNVTSYTFDSYGHLLTSQNALLQTTTQVWTTAGLLQSVTDPLGNTVTYGYDTARRLSTTTNPDTSVITLAYDSNGNAGSQTDPLGHVTTFSNDALGRVLTTTDANGHISTQVYNAAGQATTMTDPRSTNTVWAYSSQGNQLSQVFGNSPDLKQTTLESFDTAGEQTGSRDARGNWTNDAYDPAGRLLSQTDAAGNRTLFYYDLDSRLVQTVDAMGKGMLTVYDSRGRVTNTIDAVGNMTTTVYDGVSDVVSQTNALSQTTTYGYDALNRQTSVTDPLTHTSTSAFEAAGNLTASTDSNSKTTTYQYDSMHRPTVVTDPDGNKTTTAYDLAGRATTVTDPRGKVTTTTYDPANNVLAVTDPAGNTTTFTRDQNDQVTSTQDPLSRTSSVNFDELERATSTTDTAGATTNKIYNALNELVKTTNSLGKGFLESYDNLGRLIRTVDAVDNVNSTAYDADGNVSTQTDANGNVTKLYYDKDNRLTSRVDPLNNATGTAYDQAGRVSYTTDALGNKTTYGYDTAGRQITVQDPSGGTVTTAYDNAGRVTSVTDAMGHSKTTSYDPAGHVTATNEGMGTTTMAYDSDGNRTSVTDAVSPTGNVTGFQYDSANRVTVTTDPSGNKTTVVYDAVGRVSTITDGLGQQRIMSYDSADRKTGEVWKNAGGTTVNTLTFTYDTEGNLLSAANSAGTITNTYDAINRLQSVAGLFGVTLTYSYDRNSNRTGLQDSLGGLLTVVYNGNNEWTSRQQSGTSMSDMRIDRTYTARLEKATDKRYSDLTATTKVGETDYTWNAGGDLTNIQHKNGSGTVLQQATYTYDVAHRATSLNLNGASKSYSYDAGNEVTNDGVKAYTYDSNGNRTMTGYTTGTGNELTNDGVFTYTYDANGNLATKDKGTGNEKWYYGYDNLNHLLTVRKTSDGTTNTLLVTYTYDALGNVVQTDTWKSVGGNSTVKHVYDGRNLLLDLTSLNAIQTRYLAGDQANEWLGSQNAGGNAWDQTDRLGSVIGVTNASGTVGDTITYDGFGNPTQTNAAASGPFLSQGMVFSVDTNLYTTWNRSYDPFTAKWLQFDPSGFSAGDSDLTRFVGNNATNLTDPSGLEIRLPSIESKGDYAVSLSQVPTFLVKANSNTTGAQEMINAMINSKDIFRFNSTEDFVSYIKYIASVQLQGWQQKSREIMDRNWSSYAYRWRFYSESSNDYFRAFHSGMGEGAYNEAVGAINVPIEMAKTGYDLYQSSQQAASVWANYATGGRSPIYLYEPSSALLQGMDAAVKNGKGEAFAAWAVFNTGTLGLPGLGYSFAKAIDTGDSTEFSQAAGAFAFNIATLAGVNEFFCFPANTPVSTETGLRPIQSIRPGDRVWAYDLVVGEWELRAVITCYEHEHEGDLMAVTAEDEIIEATKGHPFWVVEGHGLELRPRPEHIPDTPEYTRIPGR